jgi:peptide-methionine (R)-S-oxide reductase
VHEARPAGARAQEFPLTAFDMTAPTAEQRKRIIAGLSEEEREVLLQHGTEAAFCGVFLDNKKEGVYACRFCGLPLFRSSAKFDSGTGWPSFTRPLEPANVKTKTDRSLLMTRIEVRSAHADSHLGHLFDDGPKPTGQRYCMNSASMRFIPVSKLAQEGYGQYAKLFETANQK